MDDRLQSMGSAPGKEVKRTRHFIHLSRPSQFPSSNKTLQMHFLNPLQGNCIDMLEDINTGVGWILRRIHVYGGDRKNVFLSGQSAGAHLAAVAMLTQVKPFIGDVW